MRRYDRERCLLGRTRRAVFARNARRISQDTYEAILDRLSLAVNELQ